MKKTLEKWKNNRERKIFSLCLSLSLALSVLVTSTGTAVAADNTIKSQGRIVYDNDTPDTEDDVIFDASDLVHLNTAVSNAIADVEKGKADLVDGIKEKLPPSSTDNIGTNPSWDDILKAIESIGKGSTAANADVLNGKTYYNGEQMCTGTMKNNGTVSPAALASGASYTIPQGYHSGAGKVTTKSLASQTPGNATAANLSQGVTAWVNGVKVTGTGTDNNSYYERGRVKGHEEVVANPGAFGISMKEIYQHTLSTKRFDDVEHTETTMAYGENFNYGDTVQYQIPLGDDKILYGVLFDLEYYAIRGYESPCSINLEYSLATVEGTVLQSDNIQSGPTGSTTNYGRVTKNIYIDLLKQTFTTKQDNLILTIKYSMSGSISSHQEQVSQAHISFMNIEARYK